MPAYTHLPQAECLRFFFHATQFKNYRTWQPSPIDNFNEFAGTLFARMWCVDAPQ